MLDTMSRSKSNLIASAALLVLSTIFTPTAAYAWGAEGHRVTGLVEIGRAHV